MRKPFRPSLIGVSDYVGEVECWESVDCLSCCRSESTNLPHFKQLFQISHTDANLDSTADSNGSHGECSGGAGGPAEDDRDLLRVVASFCKRHTSLQVTSHPTPPNFPPTPPHLPLEGEKFTSLQYGW